MPRQGLLARVMDVADLRFAPSSFDAVYAMNCLVHVRKAELPAVLAAISRARRTDGLLYVGQYGGRDFEGIWDGDYYEPKRFFSHYLDDDLRRLVADVFDLESFQQLPHGWSGLHFQSLILRKPASVGRGDEW